MLFKKNRSRINFKKFFQTLVAIVALSALVQTIAQAKNNSQSGNNKPTGPGIIKSISDGGTPGI